MDKLPKVSFRELVAKVVRCQEDGFITEPECRLIIGQLLASETETQISSALNKLTEKMLTLMADTEKKYANELSNESKTKE